MNTSEFTFTCPATYPPPNNKINVIKALRQLSDLSLKEAKDRSERIDRQTLEINPGNFVSYNQPQIEVENQLQILRNNGVVVGDPVYLILRDLRVLASQALLQGDDELGNEILQLVLAEKLRRNV